MSSNNKKNGNKVRKRVQMIYNTRVLWVDVTTFYMMVSYHWDFWSKNVHPFPNELAYVYWAVLCAYWIIKEQVRHSFGAIRSRPGGWYVIIWGLVLLEFSFTMQLKPGIYHVPGYFIHTCIIVLLGYVGVLSARRLFKVLFPPLVQHKE